MVGSGHGAQPLRLPQPGTFRAPSLPHVSRGALGAPPSPVSPSLLASPIATPPGHPNGSDAEDFEIHICISNSSRHLHVDGTDTSRSEGQSRTCHRPHTCTHTRMHTHTHTTSSPPQLLPQRITPLSTSLLKSEVRITLACVLPFTIPSAPTATSPGTGFLTPHSQRDSG